MQNRAYIPDTGDVVWLEFSPQSGHEQAGRRPALVLSPAEYNEVSGLMICCPMTTKIKGYPFEVLISGSVPSAVLADHIKSQDWRTRRAEFKGRVLPRELAEVQGKVLSLLGISSYCLEVN